MTIYCPVCKMIGALHKDDANAYRLLNFQPRMGGIMVAQCEHCARIRGINTRVVQEQELDMKTGELTIKNQLITDWEEWPLEPEAKKTIVDDDIRETKKRDALMSKIVKGK